MTERGEAYAEAALAIRRLAEGHDGSLDRFVALLSTGMQGPAAARMLGEAHTQAGQITRAFLLAWDAAAGAAQREGAAPGPQPLLRPGTVRAVAGGAGRRGLDPGLLNQAIREASNAGARICDAGRGLAAILSRAGLTPSPGHAVQAVGDWLLGQQYEVKRRLRLAEAAEAAVSDAFAGSGDAARPLADRLEALAPGDLEAIAALSAIAALPPSRDRAEKTNAWWRRLPEETRRRFIQTFPRTIGNLDGLPAAARHQANRSLIQADRRRWEAELRALPITDITGQSTYAGERRVLREKLEATKQIEAQLRQGGANAFLLGFDLDHGKVIMSFGDPDTADNVTTWVPGFGTTLTSSFDNTQRAYDTWKAAKFAKANETTASIYWLDYNAPLHLDVAIRSNAEGAGPRLGGFMSGIDASREHGPAHSSLLGHSYGSLAVGMTAVRFPEVADELIFVGSPGVGVHRAADLGVHPDHVWAGNADNDPVPKLPPIQLVDAPEIAWGMLKDQTRFGTQPASSAFGGKTFDVQPGPLLPTPLSAHSVYWTPDSVSMRNIASIVVGP